MNAKTTKNKRSKLKKFFVCLSLCFALTITFCSYGKVEAKANIFTDYASKKSTLRYGSTGNDVKELQYYLNKLGVANLSEDGKFGPKTLAAVKRYQKNYGLSVDGVVGPKTWASIYMEMYYMWG